MATSTIPPTTARPDMVPALEETNQLLRAARYALEQACEDLARARESALFRARPERGSK